MCRRVNEVEREKRKKKKRKKGRRKNMFSVRTREGVESGWTKERERGSSKRRQVPVNNRYG